MIVFGLFGDLRCFGQVEPYFFNQRRINHFLLVAPPSRWWVAVFFLCAIVALGMMDNSSLFGSVANSVFPLPSKLLPPEWFRE